MRTNDKDLGLKDLKIKSNFGSLGHSDGDALIHSIVDALLGAACLGDIGKYFPSNQKKWGGVKSELFLFETKKLLSKHEFQISNIDSTIILQNPKIQNCAHFPWWANKALFTRFGVMCWCHVLFGLSLPERFLTYIPS